MPKSPCVWSPTKTGMKSVNLFTQYFKSHAPAGVEVDVLTHHGGYAYVTPIDTIGYQAAHQAYSETFGTSPVPKQRRRKYSHSSHV